MLNPNPRARHRRFDYEPRYYDPTEDERLKRRIRIQSRVRRGRRPSPLFIVILLLLCLAIYLAI